MKPEHMCPRSTIGIQACTNYKPENRCTFCPIAPHKCEGCKRLIASNTLPAQVVLIPHGFTLADQVARGNVMRFCTFTCLRVYMDRISHESP